MLKIALALLPALAADGGTSTAVLTEVLDYAQLTTKVDHAALEGSRWDVVRDLRLGRALSQRAFRTRFVLDIAAAVEISVSRIFVDDVSPGRGDYDWEHSAVIVTFRITERSPASGTAVERTAEEAVHLLSQQAQQAGSPLYLGNVTARTDPAFGVVVTSWDASLALKYAIEVVGGALVRDGTHLSHGALRYCDRAVVPAEGVAYCEWEALFQADVAAALGISLGRVDLLFVRRAAGDAVLAHFRIIPSASACSTPQLVVPGEGRCEYPGQQGCEPSVPCALLELREQVKDTASALYRGNVTVRTDQTWGVSGTHGTARERSSFMHYAVRGAPADEYERCKATHRCPRAFVDYDQQQRSARATQGSHLRGEQRPAQLFADFEDWRAGSFGWRPRGAAPRRPSREEKPRGAHFHPFDQDSLGPAVPAYRAENRGLVLDAAAKDRDAAAQAALIADLDEGRRWNRENAEVALMDADLRGRLHVKVPMDRLFDGLTAEASHERGRLAALEASQCQRGRACALHFDTSSATMRGVIDAEGVVALTEAGTEVAVFAFDSVSVGPEVRISVSGQRALAILSRSSILLDTPVRAAPGGVGGFPGGFSVARAAADRLVAPRDVHVRDLAANATVAASNNVNGPGSCSRRIILQTVTSAAADVDEVQRITTRAQSGATLSGSFTLLFGDYETPELPHDISADALREQLEGGLNLRPRADRSDADAAAPGVGRVDVARVPFESGGGYQWTITFRSAIGDVQEMRATGHLRGLGASVAVETLREGNSIGGEFQLVYGSGGATTRPMPFDVSGAAMKAALEEDIPEVLHAEVERTDPTNNCADGLCENSPTPGGGNTWTVLLTTADGNVSPVAPTRPEAETSGAFRWLSVISALTGEGAQLAASKGHGASYSSVKAAVGIDVPFSLAYGGAGASYGGRGGDGSGYNAPAAPYNDDTVRDLLGGSGGALGETDVHIISARSAPVGRGGAGGGAVELVAMNDITVGEHCELYVGGGAGEEGSRVGGGGGSGGSVVVAAGGSLRLLGTVRASGGAGGAAKRSAAQKPGDPSDPGDLAIPADRGEGGGGGGGGGGRVLLSGKSVEVRGEVDVSGGAAVRIRGGDGTVRVLADASLLYRVDRTTGAQGTRSSLRLESRGAAVTGSGALKTQPNPENGLERDFEEGKPTRASFYFKLGARPAAGGPPRGSSMHFALIHGDDGPGREVAIGVVAGDGLRHGHNYRVLPGDSFYDEDRGRVAPRVHAGRWYKVDVAIDWDAMRYDLFMDDEQVVREEPFAAAALSRVGVYTEHAGTVWVDEVFVGEDLTMGARCPHVTDTGLDMDRPLQHDWKRRDIGGGSERHEMRAHYSHISRRRAFRHGDGKRAPFDGDGHLKFRADVDLKAWDAELDTGRAGEVMAGALLHVPAARRGGRYYWYGDHDAPRYDVRQGGGGIIACSTRDFTRWRFEGVQLHYANITDMVRGSRDNLTAPRPKVLYNEDTRKYVMWMTVEGRRDRLGLAGIAVSDDPTGPFQFVRTLYPDGNETLDQSVFQDGLGRAFLARTYYADAHFILPAPVMQPMWESVKRDGNGTVDFGLNYHRAFYEPLYDDFHDIYLQRWRAEDRPWEVVCVDRITGENRTVARGAASGGGGPDAGGDTCDSAREDKLILGQGHPASVISRFKDPGDPANSFWVPSSVPGVKAQPWSRNYREGLCGMRPADGGLARTDPDVANREGRDLHNCSNIADNPPHPTAPDKLIGTQTIVETRRSKYVALSRLTEDFLDTTGHVYAFEGELEDGAQLISLLSGGAGDQLLWINDNATLGSTYRTHVYADSFFMAGDWRTRFHQYEERYNDRAFYSIACVLHGDCPVAFRDEADAGP